MNRGKGRAHTHQRAIEASKSLKHKTPSKAGLGSQKAGRTLFSASSLQRRFSTPKHKAHALPPSSPALEATQANLGAGEMSLQLRVLTALPEDSGIQFPALTLGGLQSPPEDPVPSFGFQGVPAHMGYMHIYVHTCTLFPNKVSKGISWGCTASVSKY